MLQVSLIIKKNLNLRLVEMKIGIYAENTINRQQVVIMIF